jgi:two-component system sensor histidine kinase ComP
MDSERITAMHKLPHFKRFVFIFIGAVLLLIHSWVSYITFHYPYLGIGVNSTDNNNWSISEIYKGGAAEKMGLYTNDTVLNINEAPTGEHFTVLKFRDIEQAHSIEIIRNGQRYTFEIKNNTNELSSRYVLGIIGELVLFAISVFVYFNVKHSRSIYYLLAMFIFMGLAFMCAEASSRSDTLAKFITLNAMSFIPLLFSQFIYFFLKEKGYKLFHQRWLKYAFTLLTLLAAIRIAYFLNLSLHRYFLIDRFISLLCFALGSLLTIILLIVIYIEKRHEYSFSAKVIKIIFIAFLLSFLPFLLLSVVPDLLGKPVVSYAYAVWFITLFPLTFIYYTVKETLYKNNGPASFLFPIKNRRLGAFYRILTEHGQIKKLEDAQFSLLPQICTALGLEAAALRFHDNSRIRLVTHGPLNKTELEHVVLTDDLHPSRYIVYAINSELDFTSHIIMKKISPDLPFSDEQQQWIAILQSQLSIMIENVYLSEKLSMKVSELISEPAAAANMPADYYLWFRKSLYQMQEKDRRRVATDLHDTVMQDIYFAKQRVTAIQNGRLEPAALQNELKELAEYLDIINLNVRETGFQLYPHLLKEVGFAVTVSNLIETERMNVPFKLQLRIERKTEWDQLDTDVHHHLFRIMQELLSNAKKHSEANEVDFHLYYANQTFVLEYEDDGIGLNDKAHSGGIGWHGINHRINSLEGKMQHFTSTNKGLKLILTLPAEGKDTHESRN